MDARDTPLEFPCDFPLKIMGRDSADFREHVIGVITGKLAEERILDVRERPSRAGKFISLTITVRAESRDELDDVYRALHASERVLMTL
jgi:uncharacterized protein